GAARPPPAGVAAARNSGTRPRGCAGRDRLSAARREAWRGGTPRPRAGREVEGPRTLVADLWLLQRAGEAERRTQRLGSSVHVGDDAPGKRAALGDLG